MDESVLPSNFDWVTARTKCSAADMFESLRALAQVNVEKINEFRGDTNPDGPRFKFKESEHQSKRGFTVFDTFGYERRAVDFKIREDVIYIEGTRKGTAIKATLTLNDEGQCRFRVGPEELDQWQILRRALEWLFFERDPE